MAIEKRPFGRTGHMSSAVIFGAAALGKVDQATADRVLDLLLEHGVNHIDAAPTYGEAELRIGPWMERHRDEFFLATKTRERDYERARADIRRSLERLRTDRIDLLQLHSLSHPDDWEQALAPGGALEAAREARDQGLVRFIGVTGHGWTIAAMHRRSLERFDFDSILLPWNWHCAQHPTYAADFRATLALARERGIAVQTIKSLARGPWAAGAQRNHTTWYQPLEDPAEIRLAVHWLLADPGIFLNSVGDVELLPHVLEAAAELDEAPREALPGDPAMARFAERAGLASIFGL
jgi:aryl-alcohol dehydrogenase-like predicted oxidoreductase